MAKYPMAGDLQASLTTHLTSNPAGGPATNLRYVALDDDGSISAVEASIDEAVEYSKNHGARVPTVVEDFAHELAHEQHHNPSGAIGKMAQQSLDATGLPVLELDEVMRYSVDDAHRELMDYFGALRQEGARVAVYEDSKGLVDAFLGQNYKTAKQHPEEPSMVMGLTLFPADKIFDYLSFDSRSSVANLFKKIRGELGVVKPARTLCVGSNKLCRESCLVFVGRNIADIYNHQRKAVATLALLRSPEAFARILIAAIDKHTKNAPRERVYRRKAGTQVKPGMTPYVRLNVLSDVPWELAFPGLFGYYDGTPLMFYDYTKVAGRQTPDNYDLTFSFSGTNEALCRQEIARGRRVAVVFMGMRVRGGEWVPFRRASELPQRFWGLPVIDGDVSDVRPLDDAPCIVGLRWKTPGGQDIDPTAADFKFVVPAYHVNDVMLDRPPGVRRNGDSAEYLVVPVTPRYQPDRYE